MPRQIKTLEELKQVCEIGEKDDIADLFISLGGGCAKSSKNIQHWPNGITVYQDDPGYDEMEEESKLVRWEVLHQMTDVMEGFFTDFKFLKETCIGEAMQAGALYLYDGTGAKNEHDVVNTPGDTK